MAWTWGAGLFWFIRVAWGGEAVESIGARERKGFNVRVTGGSHVRVIGWVGVCGGWKYRGMGLYELWANGGSHVGWFNVRAMGGSQ